MRKAPKPKKVKCPPTLINTWVIRLYEGETLLHTISRATHPEALKAADDWRTPDGRWAEIQCITQERQLR